MNTTTNRSLARILRTTATAAAAVSISVAAAPAHAGTPELAEHQETVQPSPRRAHHLRMTLELATLFTAGNRWYWRDNGKPNEVDWQLPHGAPAIEAKLGSFHSGWRFDGNPYDINALGHPGFGMLTTFLARENGYGLGESFAISTLASGTWEVFLEWREYGSLNDMAITSTAGVPLGETAYQMIEHRHDTHLELRGGVGTENGATFAELSTRGELDLIPTRGDGTFRGGRRVAFAAEMPTDAEGVRSLEGGAKTTVAGYYQNRGGNRLIAALDAEFDYRKVNDRADRDWDLLTTVAFGPSVDYEVRQGDLGLTLGADLYADFGILKAMALPAWRAEHPAERMRNVMEERAHPYYYGLGATVSPKLNLTYGGYFAGAKLSGARFGSLDGADRDQEMVTKVVHFTDRDANAEVAVGYATGNWSLMFDGRLRHRDGRAEGAEAESDTHTGMFTLGVRH